ncbi:MAG: hypothetical protein OQL16_08585, partial [Gammaproteobacteria bacterium]|nr:hypothetical protein [Gammaproteobacteria bacterium]
MLNINNKILLAIIITVFIVAGYLVFKGYSNEKRTLTTTTSVINDHIRKRQLLTIMYNSAHKRSVILLTMLDKYDA